ncbi:MAG: hypothetical protein JW810_09415, partial [Sedimentisphaerales bacterium]|nr:hypothetical protein [Sedimentisphaerales bacterium]
MICSLALPAAAADEPPADAAAEVQHFVPPEKQLTASWKASLYDRAGRQLYQGAQLDAIGMPIGGIAAGQLYLCGDGTLGHWEIFNRHEFSGYGAHNYQKKAPAKPVDQGFAVLIQQDGRMGVYPLRRSDWAQVQWTGEYPIAWISYRDGRRPVSARMEAFSPFIPLNAPDSALPATLFQITLKNESDAPIQVGLLGWLENAVGIYSAAQGLDARRRSRILSGSPDRSSRRRYLIHCLEENPQARAAARPPVVFEDFEGPDYGDWQAQGSAFGRGPAQGTLANQQAVSGFLGKRLVNTYLGGDGTQGTLTSPLFTIERRYSNFLIGGGGHAGQTCMNLLVDGKVVRTASGANNEKLEWRSWDVQEYLGQKARFQIVDANTGGWGHVNIDQIEFADESRPMVRLADHPLDDGTMVLMAADAVSESLPGPLVETIKQTIGELNFQEDIAYDVRAKKSTVLAANFQTLEPQGTHTFSFVLGWHFPYHPHGHEYLNRFADAAAVAHYILDNRQKLSDQTHLWHDTYYDSTLPYWLLDRLHSTVANLATGTCQWWQSGRFWAWEGVECCPGTCTHVWNYEHALARLFPELERSVREMQDFGAGFEEGSGLVGFRSNRTYAADGQCGTVLKAYREHLLSADDAFLRRNWPKIKKTLEFSIRQDQNEDGLIENSQHNTFDINFFGANTFVGSLYLAALRAAEEMAREVGDLPFAERCRTIFASGSRLSSQKLWNGEYFIQDVDLAEHPKDQYDGGCLSDQMFGQGWACQLA